MMSLGVQFRRLCLSAILGSAGALVPGQAAGPPRFDPGLYQYPDISVFKQDLVAPVMTEGPPAPGQRVRATLPQYRSTEVHYSLYLPVDWQPGAKYPLIVEYSGNGSVQGDGSYRSKHGDVSTGRVDGSCLGYGLSGGRGAIWIVLPFVDVKNGRNATVGWGDVEATVAFCVEAVKTVCAEFGGDPAAVLLCGFSRGAVAVNYIGLHNDEIAGIWQGFFAASHYDGARCRPWPGGDPESVKRRLARLGMRPVFVSHEVYDTDENWYTIVNTINYLAGTGRPLNNFRFQVVPVRNHTDRWVLHDLPARDNLRRWWQTTLSSSGGLPSVQSPKQP